MDLDNYNVVTGTVVNTTDPYGGNRIQCRLGNIHDGDVNSHANSAGEGLIYCTPLMPKLLHIIPKPGELVLVFLQKTGASNGNRFYIGPVLSQPQRYYHELSSTAQSFLDNPDGNDNTTLPNPNNGENVGSLPSDSDIAIVGRDNTEVRLKEHELRLMCGYKGEGTCPPDEVLKFNKVDPAFIQMQWYDRFDKNASIGVAQGDDNRSYMSSINVYADKINLLSRRGDVNIGELDNNELITEDKMNELLEKAHPLVFGDKLVEFLNNFRIAFTKHTHPFSMLPPIQDDTLIKINTANLDSMLSKSVKTC